MSKHRKSGTPHKSGKAKQAVTDFHNRKKKRPKGKMFESTKALFKKT